MLLKQLALAASAAAFLIPGELSTSDEDIVNALPVDAETLQLPSTAFAQTLDVPCKQCKGRDTSLRLNIAVEDGDRLTLNGFELYPNADPWHGDLTASVVALNGKEKEERLGYSLAVMPLGRDDEQDLDVVGIDLRVIEVGHRFVQGVPTVEIKLVKVPNGEILIGAVNIQEDQPHHQHCQSIWCRAKQLFGGAFRGGCSRSHRRPSHPPKPMMNHPHGDRPNHRHGHGHHRNWRQLFKNIFTQIFLPGLTGLIAGIGVAIIATILCTSVVHFVRFLRHGAREGSLCPARRQSHRVTEVAVAEEKVGLMEQDDQEVVDVPAVEKQ